MRKIKSGDKVRIKNSYFAELIGKEGIAVSCGNNYTKGMVAWMIELDDELCGFWERDLELIEEKSS